MSLKLARNGIAEMKNVYSECLIILLVSSVLVSCSSDDDDSSSFSNVSRFGIVEITDPLLDNSIDIVGFFFELQDPALVSILLEDIDLEVQQDTCELSFDIDEDVLESESSSPVNAGEVLTLSSPAGTFAEIVRFTNNESQIYFGPENLPAPVPSGLVFNIPGDEFPAFSDVSVPDVEPFVLTSERVGFFGDEIPVTSEITWEAGSDPEARIRLYYVANVDTSSTLGVEEVTEIDLDCILLDDGSFAFDAAMKTQLTESGFDTITANIGRQVSTMIQQGDALLVTTNTSGDL